MFLVDKLQVVKGNFTLFWSLSLFSSLVTFLRSTSQVNHLCFANLSHWFETWIQWFENLVFSLIHIAKIFHKLRKNIFISKNTSFWDLNLLRESLDGLVKFLDAGEDGVDLESESPSGWLFVVLFQHINVFTVEILPLWDRFFNPLGLRHFLSEHL